MIIAAISTGAAAGGLIFTVLQLRKNARIDRGTFWLRLEEMFQRYDDLYEHLRFDMGKWFCNDTLGPSTDKEKALLCDYLGLIEHCNVLLNQGIIDMRTFQSIYKTRIMGLLSNKTIREELDDDRKWSEFYDLLFRLNLLENRPDGSRKIIEPAKGWKEYIKSNEWRS